MSDVASDDEMQAIADAAEALRAPGSADRPSNTEIETALTALTALQAALDAPWERVWKERRRLMVASAPGGGSAVRTPRFSRTLAELTDLLSVEAARDASDHQRYRAELIRRFRRTAQTARQRAEEIEAFAGGQKELTDQLGWIAPVVEAFCGRRSGWPGTVRSAAIAVRDRLTEILEPKPDDTAGGVARLRHIEETLSEDGRLRSDILRRTTRVATAIETDPPLLLPYRYDYVLLLAISTLASFFFLYVLKNGTTELHPWAQYMTDLVGYLLIADYGSQVPLPWFPFNWMILASPLIFYAIYRLILRTVRGFHFALARRTLRSKLRSALGPAANLGDESGAPVPFRAMQSRTPRAVGLTRVAAFLWSIVRPLWRVVLRLWNLGLRVVAWVGVAIAVPTLMTSFVFTVAQGLIVVHDGERRALETGVSDTEQDLRLVRADGSSCAIVRGRVFWSLFGVYLVSVEPADADAGAEAEADALSAEIATARLDAVERLWRSALVGPVSEGQEQTLGALVSDLRARAGDVLNAPADGVRTSAVGRDGGASPSADEVAPNEEEILSEIARQRELLDAFEDALGPVPADETALRISAVRFVRREAEIVRGLAFRAIRDSVVVVPQDGRSITVAASDLDGDGERDIPLCADDPR